MGTRRGAKAGLTRGVAALAAVALMWAGGPAGAVTRSGGPALGPAGVISTVAGGVGGPAVATKVSLGASNGRACGLFAGADHLYIGDNTMVRQVSPATDRLTTPAGSGTYLGQQPGNGAPAPLANMETCGVTVDHAGNLLLADSGHCTIQVVPARTGTFYRQAMTAGHIYTVAGDGFCNYSGDGGPATGATLDSPASVIVDRAGNLVISDSYNYVVRVVAAHSGTYYGVAMTAGDIYTVAGDGGYGFSGDGGPAISAELTNLGQVSADAAGNLLIPDMNNGRVRVVAVSTGTYYGVAMTAGDIYTVAGGGTGGLGDGGPATSAELGPGGVVTDAAGNLLIADTGNSRIRVVAARTGTFYGQAMTAGDIYTIAGGGTGGLGDGGPPTSAKLRQPEAVAVDSAGDVLIADSGHGRIRMIPASSGTFYRKSMTAGDIYTIAGGSSSIGDGGPATSALLSQTNGIAVDGTGNLLIADTYDNRIRVAAASTGSFYGVAMTAGDLYTVAGDGTGGFAGDGGPATSAALSDPQGATADHSGNLLIADSANNRIRAVAGHSGTFYGQAMTAGDIYTVAGDGTSGFAGDGGPATSAELSGPIGVAVDAAGNVVICDFGNSRIRVVAESTGTYYGIPMTAGDIYTVAGDGTAGFAGDGGPATDAGLDNPAGVTVDATGNLVIADTNNNRIRVVAESTGTYYGIPMTAGDIYTVAGSGNGGFSGDGGPATSALLDGPFGIAVDGTGNLVIADSTNQRIRVVAESTGTFYGVSMTAGDIYTVAGSGNGSEGFSGDGGPATSAMFNQPMGVAVDGSNLVIADSRNQRIRMVTG